MFYLFSNAFSFVSALVNRYLTIYFYIVLLVAKLQHISVIRGRSTTLASGRASSFKTWTLVNFL